MGGQELQQLSYRQPTCPRRRRHRSKRSFGFLMLDGALQRRHLGVAKHTPSASLQASELQRSEAHAIERLDLVPYEMQHAADLSVPAFADHEPDFSNSGIAAARGASKHVALCRRGHSIIKLDARAEA